MHFFGDWWSRVKALQALTIAIFFYPLDYLPTLWQSPFQVPFDAFHFLMGLLGFEKPTEGVVLLCNWISGYRDVIFPFLDRKISIGEPME